MNIRKASIIEGTESPTTEGTTGAFRCVILVEDGTRRAAVAKRGPIGQIISELFCGMLLRSWGLNVPEPFLVEEAEGLAFACGDVGYPDLKARLGIKALPPGPALDAAVNAAIRIAASLRSMPLAMAVDEAIDNRDRNLGNILWDGDTEAWIDHAFALGEGAALPSPMQDLNKLCIMATAAGTDAVAASAAVGQALALAAGSTNAIEHAFPSHIATSIQAAFVEARLPRLAARILARFPKPDDLLLNA